uniref:Perforin-2 n=1 Tax=Strigamia maritima TaxID=126957 RepID=T1IMY9_STRMM
MYRIVISSDSRMAVGVKEKFQQVITALVRNNTEEAKHRVETIKQNLIGVKIVATRVIASVSWKNKQYFDSSLSSEYIDAILEKKIRHFGGLNWEKDSVAQCMVAVDKSGDLLSGLITASNFPRAQSSLLSNVRQMFSDVIQDYYVQNIHRGCTRPKSSNFEYIANLDDDSCDSSEVYDYVFGGFFVTNEVRSYGLTNDWSSAILKNPLTESTSCPTQFETSIVYTRMSYRMYSSYYHASVKQQFVSCLANESLGTSYLFGGLYSSDVNNIHTNDKSCPPFYSAISVDAQMGSLSICVNNSDNSFAKRYALPFGGFASASNKYQCPIGYKKYLAMNF